MKSTNKTVEELANREYEWGFVTDIEADTFPPGLNEDVIRAISHKKGEPQFMLDWRLKAYRHWTTLKEPTWAFVKYDKIKMLAGRFEQPLIADDDLIVGDGDATAGKDRSAVGASDVFGVIRDGRVGDRHVAQRKTTAASQPSTTSSAPAR